MTTPLSFGRDRQGYNAFAPAVSTNMYSAAITSGGNATITLPGDVPVWIVAFSYQPGSDIWVSYNGSAAAPAGATFAATSSELNPGARLVPSTKTTSSGTVATTINVLNNGTATADVWIGLYADS